MMKHSVYIFILGWFLAANGAMAQAPHAASDVPAGGSDNLVNLSVDLSTTTTVPHIVADDTSPSDESADNATFVDKDGDGINDGKEHRFRKKSLKEQRKAERRLMRKGKSAGKNRAARNIQNLRDPLNNKVRFKKIL